MAKKYTNKPKEFVIVEGENPPHTHTHLHLKHTILICICAITFTQTYKYINMITLFFFLSLTPAHNLLHIDINNFLCPFSPPDGKHKFFEHLKTRKMTVADMYNNNNENKKCHKSDNTTKI